MRVSFDSLLYWYPKIRRLSIPQPRTKVVLIEEKELKSLYNEMLPESLTERVQKTINENFNLPVFLRTDLMSGKFSWKRSCYYDGAENLRSHLYEIVVNNLLADLLGLPFKAIVVREYVQMDCKFTAFSGKMPVNPERRYFIDDGKVLCHHPYWIQEAIERDQRDLSLNWRDLLTKANTEYESEVKVLTTYASEVAENLKGFWSVDFCKSLVGTWWLIDCARGEKSWHPEGCKYNRTIIHDYVKDGIPDLNEGDFIEIEWNG